MVILISWFTKESPNHSTSIILPTQTMHYFILFPGKFSKYYHTICWLFHPPKKRYKQTNQVALEFPHHFTTGSKVGLLWKISSWHPATSLQRKKLPNKRSDDVFWILTHPFKSHPHDGTSKSHPPMNQGMSRCISYWKWWFSSYSHISFQSFPHEKTTSPRLEILRYEPCWDGEFAHVTCGHSKGW